MKGKWNTKLFIKKTPKKGFGIKFSGNGYLVRMLMFC